jgi:hypothetical protein
VIHGTVIHGTVIHGTVIHGWVIHVEGAAISDGPADTRALRPDRLDHVFDLDLSSLDGGEPKRQDLVLPSFFAQRGLRLRRPAPFWVCDPPSE